MMEVPGGGVQQQWEATMYHVVDKILILDFVTALDKDII